MIKDNVKRNIKSQVSDPSSDSPMKNHLYALHSRGNQKKSPNVVIVMLQVFSIAIYVLIDPSATL